MKSPEFVTFRQIDPAKVRIISPLEAYIVNDQGGWDRVRKHQVTNMHQVYWDDATQSWFEIVRGEEIVISPETEVPFEALPKEEISE